MTYPAATPSTPSSPRDRGPGAQPATQPATTAPAAVSASAADIAAAADGPVAELLGELRSRHRRFVFPWSVVFFVYYMALIVLAGWAPGLFGVKVFGSVNFGYLFALSQFVMTFFIAWLYRRYAASRLDPVAARLRSQLAGPAGGREAA